MMLNNINKFFASRWKTLVKRRKIMTKKRPISQKRLKEEAKLYNYAHQAKILQVRKELDRRKSVNTHLNEIMDYLFYPDVRFDDPVGIEKGVKDKSNNPLLGVFQDDLEEQDELMFVIQENQLATELLEVHHKHLKQFQFRHFILLLNRMNYYLLKLPEIKERRIKKWNQMIKKVPKSEQSKKQIAFPFLFLEKQEIIRHKYWNQLVKNIVFHMKKQSDIHELNKYIQIIKLMNKSLNIIPVELYETILKKNMETDIKELAFEEQKGILGIIGWNSRVSFNPLIKIQNPDTLHLADKDSHSFRLRLVLEILKSEECSAQDFVNLLKATRGRNYASQEVIDSSKAVVLKHLSDIPFDSMVEYLHLCIKTKCVIDFQFLQILKFDIYRKVEYFSSKNYLLTLLSLIRQREIRVYQQQLKKTLTLQSFDLFQKVSVNISKVYSLNVLTPPQILKIIDSYFSNSLKDQSCIEMVAAEFTKLGNNYTLQELGSAFFKLTLLGHRSKMLSRFIFNIFSQEYKNQRKRYNQEKDLYLPNDAIPLGAVIKNNAKQIYLQECLVMMIWCVVENFQSASFQIIQNQLNLQKLLDIFPMKVQSNEILMIELTERLNSMLKRFNLFPKITTNQFSDEGLSKMRQYYKKSFDKSIIEQIMDKQAQLSGKFVLNFNKETKKYLQERWSAGKVYSTDQYLVWLKESQTDPHLSDRCYFNYQIKLDDGLLQKRKEALSEHKKQIEKAKAVLLEKEQKMTVMYKMVD